MRVKLAEAFDLQMGKTPDRNDPACWGTGHKWVSIADLTKAEKYITNTKESITDHGIAKSGIKAVPKNTVIMSFKLSIGKTAITTEEIYTNEAIIAFIDKGIYEIDTDYIYHLFSAKEWGEGTNKAVLGLTLNKATLSQIEIEIPPIEKQRQATIVLDKMDVLISLRKKQLQKLDDLVKSRFVEMFGDCRTNPKGWKTIALGEISEVGSSKRVFVEELKEAGVPFYRGTEIGALAEGKEIQPVLFITEKHYSELIDATGKPEIGDLLMPSICPDGRIWVVNTNDPFYFKDGRVLWVHSISDQFDPTFLLYTLKDRIMTDYSSIASGTTFAELKIFALKQCQVFDVPMDKQKLFVTFVKHVDKSRLTVQNGIYRMEMLKQSLMQKYFG